MTIFDDCHFIANDVLINDFGIKYLEAQNNIMEPVDYER